LETENLKGKGIEGPWNRLAQRPRGTSGGELVELGSGFIFFFSFFFFFFFFLFFFEPGILVPGVIDVSVPVPTSLPMRHEVQRRSRKEVKKKGEVVKVFRTLSIIHPSYLDHEQ